MTVTDTPPGIDSPERLASWLNDHLNGDPVDLTGIQLIAGGRSNLTYRLEVAGPQGTRLLVLRRPPLGHVLPTAHDMSREYRVLTALSGSPVPVARPVAYCGDADIVASSRQTLADPDWFAKIRAGRGDEIRRCEFTNYCEALDQQHEQVTCKLWDRKDLDAPDVRLSSDGKRRLVAPRWR